MAVSRPVLLAIIGLVLTTATLFAARDATQSVADTTAAPVAAPPSPAPGQKAKDPARGASERGGKARKPGAEPKPQPKPQSKPARPARKPEPALPAGVPADVGRALRDRQIVVLFFGQGGADDVATAEGVASLRGLKRVAVFRDGIENLGKYPGIVSGLGVARAPAVVIVGSRRRAQLIEGFVDSGTLRQQVVDAR